LPAGKRALAWHPAPARLDAVLTRLRDIKPIGRGRARREGTAIDPTPANRTGARHARRRRSAVPGGARGLQTFRRYCLSEERQHDRADPQAMLPLFLLVLTPALISATAAALFPDAFYRIFEQF
jgi:hypothetical protein